ncbi:MFS transporter [Aneurinibacillus migulanus]|uniref:MFS transporter n=1 Tax=Aneurinibacillus migulanus TaxID=47500 RepID=A0A0D1XRH2_ANEMI|nr:nitrate/nitrite transporter [Aneurinibacillus migulanus]KIV49864.1 MFS transporter [Aneurinibacillus migulanus]KIV54753.1 MFS transporter [Aneurinibacillus migulanus]KON96600.1 MFS transporter [Aneurinibacillus migulanus]KPD07360.1 MFS transporter [Aneurinibacillus migulanus]MCP1358788.1 NarK/NasA family nitrate transporter [Aneurinibacillus migulanus]
MSKKGQTSALIMSTLAMVVAFAVWASLSPLASQLQKLFELTATQKSVLVATPVLLGSVMRIPLGIMTDRYGGKKMYTILMLFLIIPLIGISFANSYAAYLFWAFFIGMAGTSFAIAIAYVSRWYPAEKQGTVLGITGMGNFGNAVAGFAIPSLAVAFGLGNVFLILAAVVFITAIVFWLTTEELPKPEQTKTFAQALSVVKFKNTWILSIFYFLTFGSFVAFSIYLPTLLQDLFGISAVDAGLRAAGFVVIATLMRPIGGYLGDKIGAGRVLTYVFLMMVLSGALISFMTANMIAFSVGCLTISFLAGIGNGAVFKLVPTLFPGSTGAVTGFVGAAGGLGGFFPPIVMGTVKDMTGSYFLGFFFFVGFAILCLVLNKRFFDTKKNHSFVKKQAL